MSSHCVVVLGTPLASVRLQMRQRPTVCKTERFLEPCDHFDSGCSSHSSLCVACKRFYDFQGKILSTLVEYKKLFSETRYKHPGFILSPFLNPQSFSFPFENSPAFAIRQEELALD
eukprot:g948.t1